MNDGAVNVQRENIHLKDGFVAFKSDNSRNETGLEDIRVYVSVCVCVQTLKGSHFRGSADAAVATAS